MSIILHKFMWYESNLEVGNKNDQMNESRVSFEFWKTILQNYYQLYAHNLFLEIVLLILAV